jgi:hypothetical protein
MKFYNLETEFTFGKFEGKTIKQIIDVQPLYIDWCAINLDHFYISESVIDEIKTIKPDFDLSLEGKQKLLEKYSTWENEEDDYDDRPDYYEAFDSYEDWLEEEFGDDAETAYWNTD